MRELRQPIAHREDLVDLLLILGDDDRGLRVVEHGGDFLRHGVGVDGHRNRADHLRRGYRPVEAGPVGAHDGDGLASLKPEPDQALGNGARLFVHLGPSPSLPEAKILEAKSGARSAQGRVGAQEFCEGVLRVWAVAPRRQAFPPSIAKYYSAAG